MSVTVGCFSLFTGLMVHDCAAVAMAWLTVFESAYCFYCQLMGLGAVSKTAIQ